MAEEANSQMVIDGHMSPFDYRNRQNRDLSITHISDSQSSTTSVSTKYNNKRKCIYLFGGFIVSSCFAAIACAVLLMFIVLKPAVPAVDVFEHGKTASQHNDEGMQCMDATLHRSKARAKYVAAKNFDTDIAKKLKSVCCVDIPKDICDGILPYAQSFFPNKVASSHKDAEKYLESVDSFMKCDPNALYVFCAMVYPPCITEKRQVMPCKGVCEGVVNGCQTINTSVSIDSKLSCDYYPDGDPDEIVCKSCSYAINLGEVGEEFEFSSPNHPMEFPSNSKCVWSITSPESTRIQIDISNVDVIKQLKEELTVKFGQNPYGSSLHMQRITEDRVVLTHLNFASVIFQSGALTNGSTGFSAKAIVLNAKDTLLCESNARPITEEDLCDGVYDCVDCDEESGCTTCEGISECFDERKCRPPCGYNLRLATENTIETISSPLYSGSYEDCIYTFKSPTRFRLRIEFVSYNGLVGGCNFKYGYGDNPYNAASEIAGIPELSKPIDFPDNVGWIWLASGSDNTSFVVRVSSFIDKLIINMTGNDTYIIDTKQVSTEVSNALERGVLIFKSPPGYYFTISCINEILNLGLNNVAIGVGSEPIKYAVYTFYADSNDVLEFLTDAFWLKMYGKGPYELGFTIKTMHAREVVRQSVLVDESATIVLPIPGEKAIDDCIEIEKDNEDEIEEPVTVNYVTSNNEVIVENGNETDDSKTDDSNVVTIATTWIVASIRHPMIGVKFLNFNSSSTKFNYFLIGYGLNPNDSSTILFKGTISDFEQKLPGDIIVKYSTFWIQHISFSTAKDTMMSLELNGVASLDDLVCPLKYGVTKDDICDDEYDCPDRSDEENCGDKDVCGRRPFHNRKKRVIGGTEANLGSWPWQGLIMVGYYPHCGCTLIDEYWAITASHCLWHDTNSASSLSIMFGSISNQKFSRKHLIVEASLAFLHPEDLSLPDPMDHDIALIKFDKPVPFTNYVRPACLVRNETQFLPGDTCYISGFGRQGTWKTATELHEAPMMLYSNEKCMDFQSSVFQITDNMVCAGKREGGVGTCYVRDNYIIVTNL
ncbi:uncharacterized protein LOC117106839 [Anneissia japonica]|uniref:uncharacterized protein LOC117106839 n=1 Tax=Anneissia japonica TaxID=1529436 RepID=UPI0014255631|nr:uncharacterized protein LOC117106839 [Anneissia japonica]